LRNLEPICELVTKTARFSAMVGGAPTTLQLVEDAVNDAERAGHRVVSAGHAREIIGLPTK